MAIYEGYRLLLWPCRSITARKGLVPDRGAVDFDAWAYVAQAAERLDFPVFASAPLALAKTLCR